VILFGPGDRLELTTIIGPDGCAGVESAHGRPNSICASRTSCSFGPRASWPAPDPPAREGEESPEFFAAIPEKSAKSRKGPQKPAEPRGRLWRKRREYFRERRTCARKRGKSRKNACAIGIGGFPRPWEAGNRRISESGAPSSAAPRRG